MNRSYGSFYRGSFYENYECCVCPCPIGFTEVRQKYHPILRCNVVLHRDFRNVDVAAAITSYTRIYMHKIMKNNNL